MNLIICGTPFQVLLAERIIDLYPNEDFYGIMFQMSKEKNYKYEYYYTRLASKCIKSEYLLFSEENKIETLYNNVYMRLKYLFIPKISRVFLANIQADIIHMLLSGLNSRLYTFDDGIGNLVSNDRYNTYTRSLHRKLIDRLLWNKYSPKKIVDNVVRHFTIYHSMRNFEGKLTRINLIPSRYKYVVKEEYNKKISIFLGQPIYENIDNKDDYNNIEITKKVLKFFNIDYYFPHPREKYEIDNIEYINTDMIFEDYILNAIDSNPNTQYVLYNFLSGAALNVINVPNIKVICIKPDDLNDFWEHSYSIFENEVQIIPWRTQWN